MKWFDITEEAKHQMEKLLDKNPDKYAISLMVKGGGCAGFKYEWGFVDKKEDVKEDDEVTDLGTGKYFIVDEASKHDIPVMAHAHGDEGGYAAVKAGVRSIEHGTYLSNRTLKLMKKNGTYLVPTYTTVVDLTEPGGDYDNPILIIRGQHMLPALQKTVTEAYKMGIKISTGADTGYGPNSTTRIGMEVTNFVQLGMTPFHAIQSATVVGAELLGIDDKTGTIEAGKEADLIVVTQNPLEDIRTIQDVVFVMNNGLIGLNRLPFGKE